MAFSEVERAPESSGHGQSFGLEDLQWTLPFFATVGAHEIEVVSIGSDFGPEVSRAGEGFAIKELIFDEAMARFDIALPCVALGRDVARACTVEGRPCLF